MHPPDKKVRRWSTSCVTTPIECKYSVVGKPAEVHTVAEKSVTIFACFFFFTKVDNP